LPRLLNGEDWILLFYRSISHQFQWLDEKTHTATRFGTACQDYGWVYLFQTNKPTVGEARQSGNSAVAEELTFSTR